MKLFTLSTDTLFVPLIKFGFLSLDLSGFL